MLGSHLGLIHLVQLGAGSKGKEHLATKEECASSGWLELISGSDLRPLSVYHPSDPLLKTGDLVFLTITALHTRGY